MCTLASLDNCLSINTLGV